MLQKGSPSLQSSSARPPLHLVRFYSEGSTSQINLEQPGVIPPIGKRVTVAAKAAKLISYGSPGSHIVTQKKIPKRQPRRPEWD